MKARLVAERQGFEPWIRCRIPDFESGAFDHSATSPQGADYTRAIIVTRLVPKFWTWVSKFVAYAPVLSKNSSDDIKPLRLSGS